MMRNLVTSVLEHEQITTTVARAKELRRPLDKMITLGKRGDLSARRQALTFIKSKKAMQALFGQFAERYAERPGGYARLIRVGVRKGDGAEMAIVQLVGAPNDPFAAAEKPKARRGGGRGRKAAKDTDKAGKGKAAKAKAAEAAEQVEEEAAKPAEDNAAKAEAAEAAEQVEEEAVKPAEDNAAKAEAAEQVEEEAANPEQASEQPPDEEK
jgi:large subunit ribosomal protein L17